MTVSEIYNLIGVNIKNAINDSWESATLEAEADSDFAETSGTYITTDGEEKNLNVHLFDDELEFAIMELHEIMTEGGNNKWNKLKYHLTKEDKFDINFIWDQKLADSMNN